MAECRVELATGRTIHVELGAEDVLEALHGAAPLARLPTTGDNEVYINPVHVVTVEAVDS